MAEAEEDLALLSVGMCLALCTGPPRVLVYETAGRNLILCQHYSCHDELKGAKPKKRLPLRIGSTWGGGDLMKEPTHYAQPVALCRHCTSRQQ